MCLCSSYNRFKKSPPSTGSLPHKQNLLSKKPSSRYSFCLSRWEPSPSATSINPRTPSKVVYCAAGCLCVGQAFLGLFLPPLPTTPFLLLAAFCFSGGSESLHRWLIEHRVFGPIISDWQHHRVIRKQTKWLVAGMAVLIILPVLVLGRYP